jgi:hypothetical protein
MCYNGHHDIPAARTTSAVGDARPVRNLVGASGLTGRFFSFASSIPVSDTLPTPLPMSGRQQRSVLVVPTPAFAIRPRSSFRAMYPTMRTDRNGARGVAARTWLGFSAEILLLTQAQTSVSGARTVRVFFHSTPYAVRKSCNTNDLQARKNAAFLKFRRIHRLG